MGRGDPGFQGGMWDLGFPGMFGIPVFKGRDGAGIGARIPRNVGLEFSGIGETQNSQGMWDPEFPGTFGILIFREKDGAGIGEFPGMRDWNSWEM